MITLQTFVKNLSRVGKSRERDLKRLGIETVADLIFYYPSRHEDFSKILPIAKLAPGVRATCQGKIELIETKRSPLKRKILTEALVSDGTGSLKVIWFGQGYISKVLKVGDKVSLAGEVQEDFYGQTLVNPLYEKIPQGTSFRPPTHTARLVPIYSVTQDLTQKQIRYLVRLALEAVKFIKDWLPYEIKRELKFFDLTLALKEIHFPGSAERLKRAEHRLKFNELFLIQLKARFLKENFRKYQALKIEFYKKETKKFVAHLPFHLTEAQRKAAWQILRDLGQNRPMNRLLEGEVGSGKTVVALIAMLNVALSKAQSAYMAPTEILARQHFETLGSLLRDFKIKIGLLSRSQRMINQKQAAGGKRERFIIKKQDLIKKIASGQIDILIGTHALIQEKINFKNLALAIIDEQHRFGVEQRKRLRDKASSEGRFMPHLLSMTATPIPRTLTLTLYGDLDLAILDELPEGRKRVITKIIDPQERSSAYEFIRSEIKKGRQAFVICPLISPSDKLGVKSVTEEYKKLKEEVLCDLKIDFLHGRLRPSAKEKKMQDFLARRNDILVATSVVEVGIDVPNASIMMIEAAERFGLAQLHQFRGRVGRSHYQSYCFLFTENPSQYTKTRLKALIESRNGFELAERDLEFRGPGEIYGTAQSGFPDFKIASLSDYAIIKEAQEQVVKIIREDSKLVRFPLLKEKLAEFGGEVHLE